MSMLLIVLFGAVLCTAINGAVKIGNWLFDRVYNHTHNKRFKGKRFYIEM